MQCKTTLKYDYKIDWGKKYPPMKYHEREHHEVKVFDMKGYVNKLREEKGLPAGGGPMGMNGMPMGMMGGMMGGLPNPFLNPSSPSGPVPGGRSTAGMAPTSLDDYISMLDKKIAELEKEEEEEGKKNSRVQEPTPAEKISDIEKNMTDVLEHKVEPSKESNNKTIKVKHVTPAKERVIVEEPVKIEYPTTPTSEAIEKEETPKSTYASVEKPEVNVDVNKIEEKDNKNNSDFFDDFFGSEDE